MTISKGIENGIITAVSLPDEMVPHAHSISGRNGGSIIKPRGAGEAPDMPTAQRLKELYAEWWSAKTTSDKRRSGTRS